MELTHRANPETITLIQTIECRVGGNYLVGNLRRKAHCREALSNSPLSNIILDNVALELFKALAILCFMIASPSPSLSLSLSLSRHNAAHACFCALSLPLGARATASLLLPSLFELVFRFRRICGINAAPPLRSAILGGKRPTRTKKGIADNSRTTKQ